jgi:uncharacterized protein YkwD
MQKAFISLVSAIAALAALAAPSGAQARSFEDAVLAELNFAREHPVAYARRLQVQQVSDAGEDLATPSDPQAFAEAIAFLERQQPLKPLRPDPGLTAAALDHVSEQGPRGDVGHGQFGRRVQAHVRGFGLAGEDIDYGQHSASEVVARLIVDAGVRDRGHRSNIFAQGFELGGVSCGPHSVYGAMCVIDFAGGALARDR